MVYSAKNSNSQSNDIAEIYSDSSSLVYAVNEIIAKVGSCKNESEVAEVCLAMAENLTGSKFGFIGELNDNDMLDTTVLSNPGFEACKMDMTDSVRQLNNMPVRGLWGHVIKTGETLITNSPSTHPESIGTPKGHPILSSFMGVPLKNDSRVTGIIALANKEAGFDENDKIAIEALSLTFLQVLQAKRNELKLNEYNAHLESTVAERTHQLKERIKEASCRQQVSQILARGNIGISEAASELIDVITASFQYPEIASARLKLEDSTYETANFSESDWFISSAITSQGKAIGKLEVYYSEHRSDPGEELFWAEECSLLDSIAIDFSIFIEKLKTALNLKEQYNRFVAILDNFPEILYVADPDTYEILFTNDNFNKMLGKDVKGLICYKEFQGLDEPCSFCTNDILRKNPDKPYNWEYYNTLLNKHYNITDSLIEWPDGRKVRFEVAIEITEQKIAERKLKEEMAFIDATLDSLPGIYYVLDQDGNFKRWNGQFEKISGYSFTEFANKNALDLFADEDKPKVRERIKEVFEKGCSSVEANLVTKDGMTIPFFLTGSKFQKSETSYLIGLGLDLSELKTVEYELKESEIRFNNLVDASPLPLCFINSKGDIVRFNDSFTKMFGYTHEDLPNVEQWWELAYPDPEYREWVKKTWDVEINNSSDNKCDITSREYKITCKNGTVRTIDIGGTVLNGDMLVTCVDVTERKINEENLKSSRQQLRFALDAQQAGIWVWDIIQDDLVWDERMEILFGLEPGSFGGAHANWKELVHPEDILEVENKLEAYLKGGPAYNVIYRVIWPDKSIHHINAQSLLVYDSNDNPTNMVGICLDVSDRVEAEERLKKALADLKTSNKELERFAYVASHDLQEPLRMVGSYLELLERRYSDKLDESAHEFIEYAVDGANRMKDMINDLLTLSRVETKGNPLEPINCRKIVNIVVKNLQNSIQDTGAVVEYSDLPWIIGDSIQLTMLFQNLIGNAIKFNESDNPTIKIQVEDKDDFWQFSVIDNGIGIEQEYFDRIFIIFQRLHNKQKYSGTGIGLSLCKKIVERHGGKIWVESQPGKGTTFNFILKKAKSQSGTCEQEEE